MTDGKRLNQQVREKAAAATGTRGCNRCCRQKPADKVHKSKGSNGRVRWICESCIETISQTKRGTK